MPSEPIQVLSVPNPNLSILMKMMEKDITTSMGVPQEYMKHNEKGSSIEYYYIDNVIFDPTACEKWENIRNEFRAKIAKCNATTFLEVNDEP